MSWEIDSLKGVGAIVFNQKRGEVRAKISGEPVVYAQSESIIPHDTYEDSGMFVMYDKYNKCAAVEFMKPIDVLFEGRNLFELPYNELLNWLLTFDPEVVESEKYFISFKLGIAVFSPNKNEDPSSKCESITVFRENHFYRKIGVCDPDIFQCLLIQHGFVNRILEENKTFDSMESAYQHIFQNNTEYLVLLWNSFPIRLSYTEDIPAFANNLVASFSKIIEQPTGGGCDLTLHSVNMNSQWNISWDGDYVFIKADWSGFKNEYENVLNQWSELKILQHEFLAEWKFLFEQLLLSIRDAGAKLSSSDDQLILGKLEELNKILTRPGRFYRADTRILEL
jgi:hypothetical protein